MKRRGFVVLLAVLVVLAFSTVVHAAPVSSVNDCNIVWCWPPTVTA